MKKLCLFTGFIFIITSLNLNSQTLVKNSDITSICYAGDKVKKIYIPPPKNFFQTETLKGQRASITLYYTDVPAWGRTAVNFAVSILESLLPPDIEMTAVIAAGTMASGVLGNSTTAAFVDGREINALYPNAYYPVALAEKIYGEGLNHETAADIYININTNVNWYVGTDGKTPTSQYDLVTVIIHEFIHGLGFYDSMYADESTGIWGTLDLRPLIYDVFLENYDGEKLIDTLLFPNPSSELKEQITSGGVYFNGPVTKSYNSGKRVKLYAPSTYDAGSSIAHLDEDSTATANIDALMTPFIDRGEAIHNPGQLTMAMLGDLGWLNTRIAHDNPPDTEDNLTEIEILASIVSDTTYFGEELGLVWSYDGFETCDTLFMTSPLSDDDFSAIIPVSSYETKLEYYMFVKDYFGRLYRSPSYIEDYRYKIHIGLDTVKPEIIHFPVEYYFDRIDTIKFDAKAGDNLGIDTVYVEYKVNEGASMFIGLEAADKNEFSNSINATVLSLDGGDSLCYRIIAYDKALNPNMKMIPAEGYYSIMIEDIGPVVDNYSTDFSDAADDFFSKGFEITKPDNFSSYGLHSIHPYESPDSSGAELNFSAMLRHPVKFDANGMIISYSELVLVEPGEDESEFGSDDFYDYVVVESSVDYGKNWYPLFEGYDSRYLESWETAYNSSVDDMNSTYTGKESMMIHRTIFPKTSTYVSPGDTILIRFRLYSDPYAHGWGWAIDNLQIGPVIDQVENTGFETAIAYPNPGNGSIMIKNPENPGMPFRYDIYNSTGARIMSGLTEGSEVLTIDISGQPQGIYFIILHRNNIRKIIKYVLLE
jgi:hypothetical protein